MTDPLVLTVRVGPESLRKLNRGETLRWDGVLHPGLIVEVVPDEGATVPVPLAERQAVAHG